ncbi:MAG TPA: hypothetical protein VM734_29435 [Kofleriaceae bacterium]|nr:hypothetical protein [Kofleriaceae bacterium]
MATMSEPAVTPEMIERFRAIGLRLDRDGRLWHQGQEVSHPRLRQAILRWLDVRDDGRDIVRMDAQRYAYVDVEDAHLRVTAARWQPGDRLELSLDDGSTEELAYATLTVGSDDGLRCRVRGGKLRAKFSSQAQQVALERVERDGPGFALRAAGAEWKIGGTT